MKKVSLIIASFLTLIIGEQISYVEIFNHMFQIMIPFYLMVIFYIQDMLILKMVILSDWRFIIIRNVEIILRDFI